MLFHDDWLRSGTSVIRAVDAMVSVGANVHAFNIHLQSFLNFIISFYGSHFEKSELENLIELLVVHYKVDINQLDGNGDTPLGTAIKTTNTKIIKLIVRLGANVNDICSNNMKPIPFICSSVKNINAFKCLIDSLLECGSDINAITVQYTTTGDQKVSPLLFVMENRNFLPFMKHLVSRGASLNFVDSQGWTLLHHFIHKTTDVDYRVQVITLLRQRLLQDAMDIDEDHNGSSFCLGQITPQLSEQVLAEIFNNSEYDFE